MVKKRFLSLHRNLLTGVRATGNELQLASPLRLVLEEGTSHDSTFGTVTNHFKKHAMIA